MDTGQICPPDMMETITIPGTSTQVESICVDRMATEIARRTGISTETAFQVIETEVEIMRELGIYVVAGDTGGMVATARGAEV